MSKRGGRNTGRHIRETDPEATARAAGFSSHAEAIEALRRAHEAKEAAKQEREDEPRPGAGDTTE